MAESAADEEEAAEAEPDGSAEATCEGLRFFGLIRLMTGKQQEIRTKSRTHNENAECRNDQARRRRIERKERQANTGWLRQEEGRRLGSKYETATEKAGRRQESTACFKLEILSAHYVWSKPPYQPPISSKKSAGARVATVSACFVWPLRM
jgi:hypothetical protein